MTTFILPERVSEEFAARQSFHETYSKCLQLYKTLVYAAVGEDSSSAAIYSILGEDRLLDEFGRLKIWGDQTKASLQPQSRGSLDDFLRNEDRLGTEVQEILHQLEVQLNLAVSLALGVDDNDPSSQITDYSDGSVTDSDYSSDSASELSVDMGSSRRRVPKLAVVASHIFEHIQLLYHFGVLLRRPGLKGRFLRHSKSEELTIAETFDMRHIEEKLRHWEWQAQQTSGEPVMNPGVEEPVTLEEISRRLATESPTDPHLILSRRFAKANSQRREQLRYWEKHPYSSQLAQENAELDIKGKVKSALRNPGGIQTTGTQSHSEYPKSQSSRPTVHTFSTVAESTIHDGGTETGRPRTVYAESVVAGKWMTRVPAPPISKGKVNGKDEFDCPYCGMALSVDLMQDRQVWKRHVFRDLRPYMCTFTSCADPNKLYNTRHDWIYHEMQMHWRQWVCHVCDRPFDTKELLVTHLNDTHPGTWTSRQLPVILEMSDRPINESLILPCSLCKSELPISKLLDHTAAHMEEISLFVLPNHHQEEHDANSIGVASIRTGYAGTQSQSPHSSLKFSDRGVSARDVLAGDDAMFQQKADVFNHPDSPLLDHESDAQFGESPPPSETNKLADATRGVEQTGDSEEDSDFDIDDIISLLLDPRGNRPASQFTIGEAQILYLCRRAKAIFMAQPILLELLAPLKVCGGLNGKYHLLLHMFECCRFPPGANYLFLGNYVGQEEQSIETICLLLAYKIKYPENFFLLREDSYYNLSFFNVCMSRYAVDVWDGFNRCFDCLPLAAIIADKIFAAHGGLSPELDSFEQIRRIKRPTQSFDNDLVKDLLYAEPDAKIRGWGERSAVPSIPFGADAVDSFLKKHDLDFICRGGRTARKGHEFFAGQRVVTLCTAPSVLDSGDGIGAVMCVDEDLSCRFEIIEPLPTQIPGLWHNTLVEEVPEPTKDPPLDQRD